MAAIGAVMEFLRQALLPGGDQLTAAVLGRLARDAAVGGGGVVADIARAYDLIEQSSTAQSLLFRDRISSETDQLS